MRWITLLLALPLMGAPTVKLGDIPARFPFILADPESKAYFLYAPVEPTGADRAAVVAYRSADLVNWEGPAAVLTVPGESWAHSDEPVYAPAVYAYRGSYYLLATLSNKAKIIEQPPDSWRKVTARGTQVFVAESPAGPFRPLGNKPAPPEIFPSGGGTLFVESAIAYVVYSHGWEQLIDGAIEAVRMKTDLSEAAEEPFRLFRGSAGQWYAGQTRVVNRPRHYAAEAPFLYRTRAGRLLMLWSGYQDQTYVQAVAVSHTGRLMGPWIQQELLATGGAAHGSIVRAFDGRLYLLASPANGRAKLFELEDAGGTVRVKRGK